MTGQEEPAPPPPAVAADDTAAPVVLVVQVISLVGFLGYALAGMILKVPLDRYVLLGLVVFGIGLRPATLGAILRGMVGGGGR